MIICPGPTIFLLLYLFPLFQRDAISVHPELCFLPLLLSCYLLHASSLPLLYHLYMHQCLLMHTFCAPFVPTFLHCYLMYHCTIYACFLTLQHVYHHAPYTCLSSISTGHFSALYSRLDFLSNQVVFHFLARKCCLQGSHLRTTLPFLDKS